MLSSYPTPEQVENFLSSESPPNCYEFHLNNLFPIHRTVLIIHVDVTNAVFVFLTQLPTSVIYRIKCGDL